MVSNFWRALKSDPDAVADHADYPVLEACLHARHRWLVAQAEFRDRVKRDPEFYDARIAGWWVWGISIWIGGGWCATGDEPLENGEVPSEQEKRPRLDAGAGVHASGLSEDAQRRPSKGGAGHGTGVHSSSFGGRPDLGAAGGDGGGLRGVHRAGLRDDPGERLPKIGGNGQGGDSIGRLHGAAERGPHEPTWTPVGGDKRPNLGSSSSLGVLGPLARTKLYEEFTRLATRLRDVRVCCGDWSRVLTPAVTTGHGLTGVLLDPPYELGERSSGLYAHDGDADLPSKVRAWALANGANPLLRIVYCGYGGSADEELTRAGWRVVEWKAAGGFGSQRRDGTNDNARRERLWCSPNCLVGQRSLFE